MRIYSLAKQNGFLGHLSVGLFCALSIFLLSAVTDAYAVTVNIDKPKIRAQIASGGSESGSITIINTTEDRADIKVYLEDWKYSPTQDGAKDFAPPGTTPLSCAQWISFYPAEFTLPAYGSQQVFYSIKVPPGAEGGHYAILFFETVMGTTKNEQGVDIVIKGRIGSLFYIEAGAVKRKAALSDLAVTGRQGEYRIDAVLKNIGNVDITAKGAFNIIDNKGMVFARGQFNDVYTFAGEQAKISSTFSKSIPAGNYDLIITLDLGDMPLIQEAQITFGSYGEVTNVTPKE